MGLRYAGVDFERIRAEIAHQGISQAELYRRCQAIDGFDSSPRCVSGLVHGVSANPGVEVVGCVAMALGLKPGDVIRFEKKGRCRSARGPRRALPTRAARARRRSRSAS